MADDLTTVKCRMYWYLIVSTSWYPHSLSQLLQVSLYLLLVLQHFSTRYYIPLVLFGLNYCNLKVWILKQIRVQPFHTGVLINSLARLTSRCILFDGENITFDASLFIYISSTNIPPIMIINRIYEHQNILSL